MACVLRQRSGGSRQEASSGFTGRELSLHSTKGEVSTEDDFTIAYLSKWGGENISIPNVLWKLTAQIFFPTLYSA